MERHTKRVVVMSKLIDIISQMPEEIKKEDLIEKVLTMESYPKENLRTDCLSESDLNASGYSVYAMKLGSIDKLYIGMSRNYIKRIATHIRDLRRGKHPSQLMQKVFDENRFEDTDITVFVIASNLSYEQASRLESAYIRMYSTTNPEHGYNTRITYDVGGVMFIDGAPILL